MLVLGVEALVVDVDLLAAGLAAQVVLGQRRPLVRALVLGADQQQAPVEALCAQGLGGLGAGQAGADDDEGLVTWSWDVLVVRARNSWRVRASSRTRPCSAEVTVLAPSFCTPRSDMHRCSASRTTPTPLGSSSRCSQSAIWVVSRSWICRSRANSSTTRPSLLRPMIRSPGR